jgi:hypothetical protein
LNIRSNAKTVVVGSSQKVPSDLSGGIIIECLIAF